MSDTEQASGWSVRWGLSWRKKKEKKKNARVANSASQLSLFETFDSRRVTAMMLTPKLTKHEGGGRKRHLPRFVSAFVTLPGAVEQGQNPAHMTFRSLPVRQACCSSLHCKKRNKRDGKGEEEAVKIFMGVTAGKEIAHSDETLHLEKHSKNELSFFFFFLLLLSSHARSKLKTVHKSIKCPGTGHCTVMHSKQRQSLITWPHCAFALVLPQTVMNCAALLAPTYMSV